MRIFTLLTLVLWSSGSFGQSLDDRYILRVAQEMGTPGAQTTVSVFYDAQTGSTGEAPIGIQGWSYGICHDEPELAVISVVDGAVTASLNPDFNVIDENPPFDQPGFSVSVVIDIFRGQTLPPGVDQELTLVTYEVAAGASGVLPLVFCNTLGNPPVEAFVVSEGAALIPLQVSGSIDLNPPGPQFVRGECNNDGVFDIADVLFLLNYLLSQPGGPAALACTDACDANNDGSLNSADAIACLSALFGASPIPLPGSGGCEEDSGTDLFTCDLFDGCP